MELKSLTYTSSALPAISCDDVDAILRSARVNNPLDGITGILIFNGTAFMQILEGGETAVDDLFGRLAADTRHSNISIRSEMTIAERSFPDWSMASLRLKDGIFEGKDAVRRALMRDLPQPMLDLILGMSPASADGNGPR